MSATIPHGETGFILRGDSIAVHTSGAGYVSITGPDGAVLIHRSELPALREALRFLDREEHRRSLDTRPETER